MKDKKYRIGLFVCFFYRDRIRVKLRARVRTSVTVEKKYGFITSYRHLNKCLFLYFSLVFIGSLNDILLAARRKLLKKSIAPMPV